MHIWSPTAVANVEAGPATRAGAAAIAAAEATVPATLVCLCKVSQVLDALQNLTSGLTTALAGISQQVDKAAAEDGKAVIAEAAAEDITEASEEPLSEDVAADAEGASPDTVPEQVAADDQGDESYDEVPQESVASQEVKSEVEDDIEAQQDEELAKALAEAEKEEERLWMKKKELLDKLKARHKLAAPVVAVPAKRQKAKVEVEDENYPDLIVIDDEY